MRIRAVKQSDNLAVLTLAKAAGVGMTSLPADVDILNDKIEKSVKAFAKKSSHKADEIYLFVLEDDDKKIVGICGIKAFIGLKQPFYSYKISTITQFSKEIDVYSKHQILSVVNDYTDCSEIGSLFLLPEYRGGRLGQFLSRVRFMFMAEFKDNFAKKTISEIRGVHRQDGTSPFYNNIAKKFFQIDFAEADYINAIKGSQFIGDLLPKNPIYIDLLSDNAKEVF